MTYRLYGLHVQSTRPIPALFPSPAAARVDVSIRFDQRDTWPGAAARKAANLRYASAHTRDSGGSALRVCEAADGAWFRAEYADGTEFLIDRSGATILPSWRPPYTLEDACVYLLGPVLGFALRLRGVTCLHASAIDVGGSAVVICGPGGAGKSTAAAVFAQSGHGILSDDVVALDDRGGTWFVQPAYPRVGLWSDSVEALFDAPDRLPRQTPNWDKCFLDLTRNGYRFRSEPLPLKAIYLLDGRQRGSGAPSIAPLSPRERLARLIENAYVNYLLDDRMRARDFDVLGRVASHVPVRRLVPHADPARLPRLRDAILHDLDRLDRTVAEG